MADYCPKCGKNLKPGESCDCNSSEKKYIRPRGSKRRFDGEKRPEGVIDNFFNILTSPVEAGRKYIIKGDMYSNIIFMLVQAIVSGLFAMLVSGKKNQKLLEKARTSIFDYSFGETSSYNDVYYMPTLNNFFRTIGFSLAITIVMALLLYFILKCLKINFDFKNILSVVVIKCVPIIVIDIVACATLEFSSTVAWVLFLLSGCIGVIYDAVLFVNVVAIENDKKLLVFVLMFSIFFILLLILIRFAAGLYVPNELANDLDYVMRIIFFMQ